MAFKAFNTSIKVRDPTSMRHRSLSLRVMVTGARISSGLSLSERRRRRRRGGMEDRTSEWGVMESGG